MNRRFLKQLISKLRKGSGKKGKKFSWLNDEEASKAIREFNREIRDNITEGYEIKSDVVDTGGEIHAYFTVPGVSKKENISLTLSENPEGKQGTHKLFLQIDTDSGLYQYKNLYDEDEFVLEEIEKDKGEFEKTVLLNFHSKEPLTESMSAKLRKAGVLEVKIPYSVSESESKEWEIDVG